MQNSERESFAVGQKASYEEVQLLQEYESAKKVKKIKGTT